MQTTSPPTARIAATLAVICLVSGLLGAQVHYHEDGRPWSNKAAKGPDAEVEGWFYNLGVTGLRVELMKDEPKHLLVRHVLERSPAARAIKTGDVIIGIEEEEFATEHRNGYGMEVFGPHGPILEFARAIESTQGQGGNGWLRLRIRRGEKEIVRPIELGTRHGNYAPTFPMDCPKSERILAELCRYLADHQRSDGSWGSPPIDLFAPLALLASGERKYLAAVEKNVRYHARTTAAEDASSLINWRYMTAAIVLAEYRLATGKRWVDRELMQIRDFLVSSQYMDPEQINPKARESHPGSVPKKQGQKRGGWGHNPGHEGYGAISMITAQGALSLALMDHCGIEIDRERLRAACDFLARGTGKNGYLWYEDSVAGDDKWADMGRTGASAIALHLLPFQDEGYAALSLRQARIMGEHPESFPDTHGSPLMGMGFAAMGARVDPDGFRKQMDANRWWFTLARCPDGSFYYQPNRDNAGYGADSRLFASAVTAFIFSMRKPALHVTGKPFEER